MKYNNKNITETDYLIIYSSISAIIIRSFMLANFENSVELQFLFYFAISLVLYSIYTHIKSTYKNTITLFIISSLLLIIFPILHETIFRNTDDNYTFSTDYLNHKKKDALIQLKNYNDVEELINISKLLPMEVRNIKYDDSLVGKMFFYKTGKLIYAKKLVDIKPQDRDHYNQSFEIDFINKYSNKTSSIKITSESIIEGINKKSNRKKELLEIVTRPEIDTHYVDIWLDSITVFAFSNIKPIGRTAQVIQLLQVITTFFFLYILTSFLDNFKQLKITKKDE